MLYRLEEQFQSDLRIIVITHHHREPDAHPLIRVAPVDDRVRNEILIRNQRVDPVAVADDDITPAQLLHPAEVFGAGAGMPGEADDVTGFYRLVHQQHEPADEVAGDGLQAEAQAETDRARQHVQGGDINTRGVDAKHDAEAHQQEIGEFRDADTSPDRQLIELHDTALESARNETRDHHEGRDDHQAFQQRPEAELRLAGNEIDAVQGGLDFVEPAHHREAYGQPEDESNAAFPGPHPRVRPHHHSKQVHPEPHEHQGGGELQRRVDRGRLRAEHRERCANDEQHNERDQERRQQHRALQHPELPHVRPLGRGLPEIIPVPSPYEVRTGERNQPGKDDCDDLGQDLRRCQLQEHALQGVVGVIH